MRSHFARRLAALEKLHGRPKKPIPKNPFEWVLWENVAYLVDDERRELAFRTLGKTVGLAAGEIARAADKVLHGVTQLGGMHPEQRVARLKGIANLALEEGSQDLSHVLDLPVPHARKVLKKFPSIGDPGADRILLFCGVLPTLAPDSNGLRVVVRLGYGREENSYSSTYRSALEALAPELEKDCAWLTRAHRLLRTHGKTLCKTTAPDCDACPLAESCRFFAREG
jgi:endonuclease-3